MRRLCKLLSRVSAALWRGARGFFGVKINIRF